MVIQADDKPSTPLRASRQIRPIGTLPDPETLLVGALLWAAPEGVLDVLTHVRDDDLGDPTLRVILAAVREVIGAGGSYTPIAVLDRLERRDGPRTGAIKALNDCLTSGAASCPEAVRDYAAIIVGRSLRRCLESGGHALQVAAGQAGEGDLAPLAGRVTDMARDIAHRLEQLRGEAL
jgi:replicative DNA helicase